MLTWQVEYPASLCLVYSVVTTSLHLKNSTELRFGGNNGYEDSTIYHFLYLIIFNSLDFTLNVIPFYFACLDFASAVMKKRLPFSLLSK